MSLSINTDYEQYLLKEYLGYRLYNILTDTSMRVRLARIKYINPEKPRQSTTRYAFFTEHFKSAASRSGAKLLPRESFNHEQLDSGTANLLALYQFMIGNTDWSIVRQRNTILIERPGGIQVPLPYDFDMSGLVNAAYAGPPPTLPIDDVRQRYFLGFCDPTIAWDSSFNAVHQKQLEILALPGEIPGLHKSDRRNAKRYLEKFFNILASDERRTEKIVGACQPWPPSGVDHMSRELNESSRRK